MAGKALNGRERSDEDRPAKRIRVVAACESCRSRKVKCDGKKPVCTPCAKRHGTGKECVWTSRRYRGAGISKEDILQLRRRIEDLEGGGRIALEPPEESSPPESAVDDETDKVNAMMGLADEGWQEKSDDWDSSANNFIRQIKAILANKAGSGLSELEDTQSPAISSHSNTDRRSRRNQSVDIVRALPDRREADRLLAIYWHLKATLFPILEREEFDARYEALWSGQPLREDDQIFFCMINIMFSLATILDPAEHSKQRLSRAGEFYQRAQQSLNFTVLQSRSTLTIQCFLLLGSYLQSTNDSQQCWVYVGLAIRIAQSLGLDRASTSANAPTIKRRETLRKIWHGCVFMDRVLSLAFGRQPIISFNAASQVPLPLGHDPQQCKCFINLSDAEPGEEECHFFVESLKYYELISQTLMTLYNSPSDTSGSDDPYVLYFGAPGPKTVGYLAEIDQKLRSWRSGLPFHLRSSLGAHKSKIHRRQSNTLWLRDHYIRLLMLRPILSRFCSRAGHVKESLEELMPWQLALQISVLCVKTALEVIEFFSATIQETTTDSLEDIIPAWWYSILYIYTAASVMVVARINPGILDGISETVILEACRNVIQVLKRFETYSPQAKTYSASIEMLFSQVTPSALRTQRIPEPTTLYPPHPLLSQPPHEHSPTLALGPDRHLSDTISPGPLWWETRLAEGGARDGMQAQLHDPGQEYGTALQMGDLIPGSLGSLNFTDTSNLWMDLCDMTWLNNVPFQ
ncbi:hypothetical protein RBB50_005271 [Rhinocladiella similis]